MQFVVAQKYGYRL